LVDYRHTKCWNCEYMGKHGKEDARGKPIAWCLLKNHIVAPEIGCSKVLLKKKGN